MLPTIFRACSMASQKVLVFIVQLRLIVSTGRGSREGKRKTGVKSGRRYVHVTHIHAWRTKKARGRAAVTKRFSELGVPPRGWLKAGVAVGRLTGGREGWCGGRRAVRGKRRLKASPGHPSCHTAGEPSSRIVSTPELAPSLAGHPRCHGASEPSSKAVSTHEAT